MSRTLVYVIACILIAGTIFAVWYAIFVINTQGGEPDINPLWGKVIIMPFFIALVLFGSRQPFLNTITITDRLIEIGQMPAFEKSEIEKVTIQKVDGFLPIFNAVEFEFKDAAKMARISNKFSEGKYKIEGYISHPSIKILLDLTERKGLL
ncbi:MAG: hypothetical protein LBL61_06540 [Elusimicrobiota bacterium]|nr:hypothetical protein [Elusimicrobiota bacterium]